MQKGNHVGSFIDAHCHLSDLRWGASLEPALERARKAGVTGFALGGVDPEDWRRQQVLRSRFPHAIWTAFGLHPWWVSQADQRELEEGWQKWTSLAPEAQLLGEMGLDYAPRFKTQREIQIFWLRKQLSWIQESEECLHKPLVLHVVRAHDEMLQILESVGAGRPFCGMVHSFHGSWEHAERYLRLGFCLSFSGQTQGRTSEVFSRIPLEAILLETDAPDQLPVSYREAYQINEPALLVQFAEDLSRLRLGTSATQLLVQSRENFLRLMDGRI